MNEPVVFRWGRGRREISAQSGETVGVALLRSGIYRTGVSTKYRRARGLYCLRGDCGTCLVRVDGIQNCRSCMIEARDGMEVQPQGGEIVMAALSPLVDSVSGDAGIDHHHLLLRPRIANIGMQSVARLLAASATLPTPRIRYSNVHKIHRTETLIVGAGAAGFAAWQDLSRSGRDLLWVDRGGDLDFRTRHGVDAPADLTARTTVFGAYREERVIKAVTTLPDGVQIVRTIIARNILVANGSHEPTLAVPNNDRPGVVSARGLLFQLRRRGSRLEVPMVVVGEGEYAGSLADKLGVRRVVPGDVKRIVGSPIRKIELQNDNQPLRVKLVAFAAKPSPAYELARQAGALVQWDGGGFAVVRRPGGLCAESPWRVWAAGDVTGYLGPAAAAVDGRRVARSMLSSMSKS